MSTGGRRRSRTRRVLKWGGTVACVAIGTTWLFSGWWKYWMHAGRSCLILNSGEICFVLFEESGFGSLRVGEADQKTVDLCKSPWPTFGTTKSPIAAAYVSIPFFLVFFLAAAPTAVLWWRDRRIPLGHCQNCGYDVTANVSGVCPECGTPITGE